MKVSELIEKLQKLPQDMDVYSAGAIVGRANYAANG